MESILELDHQDVASQNMRSNKTGPSELCQNGLNLIDIFKCGLIVKFLATFHDLKARLIVYN